MSQASRFDLARFKTLMPEAYAALAALSKSVAAAGVEKEMIELLKVRVSQINGCTFCTALHIDWARQQQVAQRRLDLVATWHEAQIFSARERAALAWAEALTLMASGAPRDAVEREVADQFSESEILGLTIAIGAINAWNRIAGGLRFPVPEAEAA